MKDWIVLLEAGIKVTRDCRLANQTVNKIWKHKEKNKIYEHFVSACTVSDNSVEGVQSKT